MRICIAIGLCLSFGTGQSVAEDIVDGYELVVDETGDVRLPEVDFRADWTVLGSWIVAGGELVEGQEGALGLHVTYTQPGVVAYYLEHGRFPDGAVLVKELLAAETELMTTGVVSHASEVEGWFVMVKDAEGRFQDGPNAGLWGDGWGWAYFGPDGGETLTTNYADECLACHVPAQETDWVYVHGYPVLRGALHQD